MSSSTRRARVQPLRLGEDVVAVRTRPKERKTLMSSFHVKNKAAPPRAERKTYPWQSALMLWRSILTLSLILTRAQAPAGWIPEESSPESRQVRRNIILSSHLSHRDRTFIRLSNERLSLYLFIYLLNPQGRSITEGVDSRKYINIVSSARHMNNNLLVLL